jgi:hypothetical protein
MMPVKSVPTGADSAWPDEQRHDELEREVLSRAAWAKPITPQSLRAMTFCNAELPRLRSETSR